MSKSLRQRKPVDYTLGGGLAVTGTPAWLKLSKKVVDENKDPDGFSPELGDGYKQNDSKGRHAQRDLAGAAHNRTKSAPLQQVAPEQPQLISKARKSTGSIQPNPAQTNKRKQQDHGSEDGPDTNGKQDVDPKSKKARKASADQLREASVPEPQQDHIKKGKEAAKQHPSEDKAQAAKQQNIKETAGKKSGGQKTASDPVPGPTAAAPVASSPKQSKHKAGKASTDGVAAKKQKPEQAAVPPAKADSKASDSAASRKSKQQAQPQPTAVSSGALDNGGSNKDAGRKSSSNEKQALSGGGSKKQPATAGISAQADDTQNSNDNKGSKGRGSKAAASKDSSQPKQADAPAGKPTNAAAAVAVQQEAVAVPPAAGKGKGKAQVDKAATAALQPLKGAKHDNEAGPSNVTSAAGVANATAALMALPARPQRGALRASKVQADAAQIRLPQPDPELVKQLLAPGAAISNPKAFNMLQDQYCQLQALYQQLKAQKIQDLEGLLDEQDEYVDALSSSVHKLADHWRAEAERQAELGRRAGSAEFVAKAEILEEENALLKQSRVELEEEAVQLRKELAERDARAAAAHAHVAEMRMQMATKLEEARGLVAAAEAAQEQLNQELQQARACAGSGEQQVPGSAVHGMRNISLQCPTPAAPSPGIGFQFPTPMVERQQQPSPGIGVQFPTPAMQIHLQASPGLGIQASPSAALAQLQASAGRGARSLRGSNLGLGLPPASAMMKRRTAPSAMQGAAGVTSVNQAVPPSAIKEVVEGPAERVSPGAGVLNDLGSPVEGLCQEDEGGPAAPAQLVTEPRSMAPEAFELVPDKAPAQQQQAPLPQGPVAYGFVDLDPSSAVKAAMGASAGAQAKAAATAAPMQAAAALLPGRLDRLMSAVKDTTRQQQQQPWMQQQAAEPDRQQQLSEGMAQLLASANAAAGSLRQQTASRSLNAVTAACHAAAAAAPAAAGSDPVEDSAAELSNQLSSTHPAPRASMPLQQVMLANGMPAGSPAVRQQLHKQQVSGSITDDNHGLVGQQRESSGLKTPGMTPKTARLVGGVVNFFGFKVVPLRQEGCYEYIHPQSGLRFQLGPMQLEDSELAADERADEGQLQEEHAQGEDGASSVTVLLYKPVTLGMARLPRHLQEEIMVPLFTKHAFVNQLWNAVNSYTAATAGGHPALL